MTNSREVVLGKKKLAQLKELLNNKIVELEEADVFDSEAIDQIPLDIYRDLTGEEVVLRKQLKLAKVIKLLEMQRDYLNFSLKDFFNEGVSTKELGIQTILECLLNLSLYDWETGLYNSILFKESLKKEMKRAARKKQPFSVVLIEVSEGGQMKEENSDTLYLEKVFENLSYNFKTVLRQTDYLGRYLKYFGIILPETDATGSMIVARKLETSSTKSNIKWPFKGERQFFVNISVVTFLHSKVLSVDEMLQQGIIGLRKASMKKGSKIVQSSTGVTI